MDTLFRVVVSKEPRIRTKLIEIIAVLGSTGIAFTLLKEDMQTFGYCVYAGLVYVVANAPDKRASLYTGLATGVIGALTEHWGCVHTGLWNWVSPVYNRADLPTRSLWMVGGSPQGFPIEVVIAYAGAGWWMASLSKVVLYEEHTALKIRGFHEHGEGGARSRMGAERFLLAMACAIVILHEPAYLQSALLTWAGWHIALGLPPRAREVAIAWGVLVGCAGFFFEMCRRTRSNLSPKLHMALPPERHQPPAVPVQVRHRRHPRRRRRLALLGARDRRPHPARRHRPARAVRARRAAHRLPRIRRHR